MYSTNKVTTYLVCRNIAIYTFILANALSKQLLPTHLSVVSHIYLIW